MRSSDHRSATTTTKGSNKPQDKEVLLGVPPLTVRLFIDWCS